MGQAFYITSFYKFTDLHGRVEAVQNFLETTAAEKNIKGLVVLANEGINSTLSAENEQNLNDFKENLRAFLGVKDFNFKDSEADNRTPFRRFKVKVRPEIVTLGRPDLAVVDLKKHLSPTEWNRTIKEEKDILLIDTRNWYETKLGTFKNAIDPKIDQFTEFPKYVKEQNFPKDKKMLIFCTGGIRCEKAIMDLHQKGYENVYQLDGGILRYLQEHPNDEYEGECFVFDHRVAVDQNLKPTQKYFLCPHCGQPAQTPVECKYCHSAHGHICEECAELEWKKDTCTKDCCYQLAKRYAVTFG